MAEHKHGDMDIEQHERTFEGFVTFVTRTIIAIVVLLVLMAIFLT